MWRVPDGAATEVLVVHRPRYDDWTLPKGKAEQGETDEVTAVREVEEETGYRCRLGRELTSVAYHDNKGRPKLVRYWEMTVLEGDFTPNEEVDALAWVTIDEARGRLSYPRDRVVLDDFAQFAGER